MKKRIKILLLAILIINSSNNPVQHQISGMLENPLLFALVPPPLLSQNTFGHQMETFGNHRTSMDEAPRGGDLCLMDTQGNVRFLTKEAGFGVVSGGIQSQNGIAVRQPCVHWSGTKALFSMIIGGPIKAYDISYLSNRWQIYEITNLDAVIAGAVPIIIKVPNQSNYNNVSPIYGSDDQIIYTSDAPLFNMLNTYPQRDEYESATINTGIFKLNPITGAIVHLTHSVSGDFDLHLASDGRIISTRWEHLKRDQQADADRRVGGTHWDPVNYESESVGAAIINGPAFKNGVPYADAGGTPWEVFPEARVAEDPTRDPNEPLHDFNEFLPWEITENGERHQTMNHVGRHEFGGVYQDGSKKDDPNLIYTLGNFSNNPYRQTVGSDAGIFQIKEDPRPGKQGTFYGTWSKEFGRFASGRIFEFSLPIGANPQNMAIIDWTNPVIDVVANTKGHFRNPLMLMNGTMIVSYASQSGIFSTQNGFHFQLSTMQKLNASPTDTEHVASPPLTGAGIERDIVYWANATQLSVHVKMNEVDVVEITPRNRPNARPKYEITSIEKQVLDEEAIDETNLRNWMKENNLALIVIRNITERDQGETQQPYNLRVPGGISTIPTSGKIYDISHFQIFSAELIRAYGLKNYDGRRALATPLRNTEQNPNIEAVNLIDPNGPEASVKISADGSVAAFVPATRAMSWQTVAPNGEPIVRERQWITFAPGEIRTCEACHGVNNKTNAGNPIPTNKPEALRKLLIEWKTNFGTLSIDKGADIKYINGLREVVLYQNFPNPFNNSTTLEYKIGKSSMVTIKILNILGQEVALLENTQKASGKHRLVWNGTDKNGKKLESGMYFCHLIANGKVVSKKIIIQ